jgi:predicted permease
LIRQLVTESALLALLGATGGIALAANGDQFLTRLMPNTTILAIQTGLDLRFLGFVIAVTCGCVMIFGLVPALIGSRFDVGSALRANVRAIAEGGSRTRTALVIAQFALALSALVCTALFLRRDREVHAMDFGFRDPEHVLLIQTDVSSAGHADIARWRLDVERAEEQLARLPGVRQTTVASFVPLGFFGYTRRRLEIPGQSTESRVADRILVNAVGPDYFDLMRIPVLSGRSIEKTDTPDGPDVAVVNQTLVDRYFPGVAPLGRTIILGGRTLTVVGVAKDGKYDFRAIDDPTPPFVYTAWHQWPSTMVTFQVRTDGDPLSIASAAQATIHTIDSRITILAPVSLAEYSSLPFFPSRSALIVISVLGVAALILASMGLFAVISYGVELRRREIGIRMALGATRARVVVLFLRASTKLVMYGLGAGAIAAALFVAGVRSRLPELPSSTVREFLMPALILAISAIAAGFLPARRAARIDPATSLRAE